MDRMLAGLSAFRRFGDAAVSHAEQETRVIVATGSMLEFLPFRIVVDRGGARGLHATDRTASAYRRRGRLTLRGRRRLLARGLRGGSLERHHRRPAGGVRFVELENGHT